ncbi:hypothetical protein FQN54_000773 [Arachnomyces sp. PD_36]|nr:hypothetical protein FQN54_000773 [Arachnomyces sp. PD_36]
MSVLRHGSSFFQRRLTKLYSDTKSSCESVTTASRPNDDPELVALNRNFRTQKDRLLAWGLDWSDANAAQPNDIDESLSEAGFSDVVAGVMSSIQELLNEAERLQHPEIAQSVDSKGNNNAGGFPSGDSKSHLPVKNNWTDQEISRSKDLLAELTSLIDTLYDLSRSRRNMSMSMTSTPTGKGGQVRPSLMSKSSKSSKESFYLASSGAKSPSSREQKQPTRSPKQPQPFEIPHFLNCHMSPTSITQDPAAEQSFIDSFFSIKHLYINPGNIELSTGGSSHASNPPPYEAVAASANSRVTGFLKASGIPPTMAISQKDSMIPIMAEFSPMMLEQNSSILAPPQERLDHLSKGLHRLTESSKVSHLGLMKFLGFFIDVPCSRFAFVYEVPSTIYPSLGNLGGKPNICRPEPLVSFFQSGEDRQEVPIPSLENRFRLAYNLVLSVLHLRSQNLVHGNINSSNILVFPEPKGSGAESKNVVENLHRPYLTSAAQFSGSGASEAPAEPLSSSMYRHPDDRRVIGDESAWAYDLYSVGLVLLEIGLWTPLSRLWKLKYNNAMFKSRIENVYVKKLAAKCGSAYLQTVQLCLDAPNFHLSTQPIVDLCLRLNQTSCYPGTESNMEDPLSFSKNFVFTMTKVLWRCCSLDIFSPPPVSDLEESSLPPAISAIEGPTPPKKEPVLAEESITAQAGWQPPMVSDVKPPEEDISDERKPKKRTLKKLTNLEIPQPHLDEWNITIMPKLSKLLKKILKDSSESCSASLMITGETEDTAKTTICVTCSNVKRVRAALKKYLDYDRENWDLIVLRGDIRRSKVPKKRRRKPKASGQSKSTDDGTLSQATLNPHYQQRPVCGASIGAFRDEEHLPPVSYGGSILVDGMPYGMTVHHMLDAPSDEDEAFDEEPDLPPRSSANSTLMSDQCKTEFQYSWCDEDPPEVDYEFEISDDEDFDDGSVLGSVEDSLDEYWLSDDNLTDDGLDDDDDDDDTGSIGDTPGIDPAEDPQLVVTQPAIDDIHDDFFPTLEDKDDEHLASHSLGYIHASSGVRRWLREGIKHEVDWALIKMDEARMELQNTIMHDTDAPYSRNISKSRRSSTRSGASKQEFTNLDKVARIDELGGTKVHCCGRTSGLQSGQISRAMTLVKMHGRKTFSTSFSVDGNFGVPGDSGAWVFDKSTGQVCGHVLAWSEKSRTAYIAPMQVLLEDIARTLGASRVTLPGSQEEESPQLAAIPTPVEIRRPQPTLRKVQDQLPIDLGRLSLNLDEEPRSRGLKDVATTTYRAVNPLLPRTMERPLA